MFCPICKLPMFIKMFKGNTRVYQCKECGHIEEEEMKDPPPPFYDSWFEYFKHNEGE